MTNSKNVFYTINLVKRRIILRLFTIFFILFALFILYVHFIVSPVLINSTSAKMKTLANKSMDYAVTEAMSSFVTYDDLIKINKDEDGNIKTMQANSSKVNNISRMVTQIALSKLGELGEEPLRIKLGAFTGISAFSGLGPYISFNVFPYGDISCSFLSVFCDAGINQTQHKIYINVDAIIRVIFPFRTVETRCFSDVLICESVIVGDIPDTYLKSNSLTEMLNLVP